MKVTLQSPKTTKIAIFALLVAAFFIVSVLCDASLLFCSVMVLWCGLVIFTLYDLKNRAAYLVFLLAFFLFLLGGEFFELYMGYKQDFTFIDELDTHAYICLLISLVFLHLGYCITDFFCDRKAAHKIESAHKKAEFNKKMRRITQIGLYASVVPYFLTTLDVVLFTLENGYLSYYIEYQSRLPGMIESISDLFPLFLFLYLATLPPKKECTPPMLLYLVHGILALLTGRRIMFGVAVLVLGFYIIIRHWMAPEERWLNKKKIILVLVACPLVIVGMYIQRYVRYGETVENNSGIWDIVIRLLSQQGSSISILKLQKEVEGDPLGCTSLYYTLHYLRGNFITRNLFDFPMEYYAQRTVETAYNTNCLADYIMYKVNAEQFFAGYGLGTSYIAELNHDLGYFGIALGSAIYGALINWLYSAKRFSFWKFAMGLLMLEEFVILPRYGADVILRPFYNLTRILVLILLIISVKVSKDDIAKIWNKIKGRCRWYA